MKTSNNQAPYFLFFILLSFFLISCNRNDKNKKTPPPVVTTTKVLQKDIPIYIDAIGQVIATSKVNIRPQIAGKLVKTFIEQGALVNEGDVIYEIDKRPYQAILDEAKAQLIHDTALLEYAKETVDRYRQVVDDDFISILNYDQYVTNLKGAQAQVEQDEAAVTAAAINLDFCSIQAPVSGKISYFNVDVGNVLQVYDINQITTILPFSPIDILFSIPQQQFEMIRKEQGDKGLWPFIATLPEKKDTPFSGTTYFIDNQIDQDTGTILLKGRLQNEKRELWPGEFIRVKILYKIAKNALIVPPSCVLIGKKGPYIYMIDNNNKAMAKNIVVLTKTEDFIAFESTEIKAGDTVILDGQINVAEGLEVKDLEIK